MAKRMTDLLLSAIALLFALPVLIILAVLIRAESPGPAIYVQDRVGRSGKVFRFFKLRSMVQDADQKGGFSTAKGDPRITRIGRIIRATSLDELPQILNVIRGDMSLVGPRPDVPKQEQLYRPKHWQERHQVRPGITGLAQARLRSAATPSQRLAHDLFYVRHQNLCLDIKIIWMTFRLVLSKLAH
ncbi:MAG: sugar transferase [Rhodobacteraceae bacterium]|nr:sugar transferase [Paracoccaceae bacterium]